MGSQEASTKLTNFTSLPMPFLRTSRRLLQNHDSLLQHIQISVSIVVSALTLLFMAWWRNGEISAQYRLMAITSTLIIFTVYKWRGLFRRFDGSISLRLLRSWLLVVALAIGTAFFSKTSNEFSRIVIIGWISLGYLLQLVSCDVSYRIVHKFKGTNRMMIRTLVLGSTRIAEHLVDSLNKNDWVPDQVIGIVDDARDNLQHWSIAPVSYLGTFKELRQVVAEQRINRIYIALPISCSQMIEQVYRDIADAAVDIVWVPDIFNMCLLNHSVRELGGLPLITLSESPLVPTTQYLCKSAMDKTIAVLMLIALSPLMLLVALLVSQSSPGPIIFKQKRHGWDGRVIEVWKFRSMYMHDDTRVRQASRNDERITPIGRFIRRTSIDELPQLFNVLGGTMSLVGPRPHAVEHNGFYAQYIQSYMLRHRIKPGMTGLAQIKGYRGETETLDKMLRRVELDLEYINNWSPYLDICILLKTPFALLFHKAY